MCMTLQIMLKHQHTKFDLEKLIQLGGFEDIVTIKTNYIVSEDLNSDCDIDLQHSHAKLPHNTGT